MHVVGFVEKNDIYNLSGCLSRAMKNLIMTLFAINEIYPIGDKRAIDLLEETQLKPVNLKEKIEQILSIDKANLNKNLNLLQALFEEVVNLADGMYKPVYVLKK